MGTKKAETNDTTVQLRQAIKDQINRNASIKKVMMRNEENDVVKVGDQIENDLIVISSSWSTIHADNKNRKDNEDTTCPESELKRSYVHIPEPNEKRHQNQNHDWAYFDGINLQEYAASVNVKTRNK